MASTIAAVTTGGGGVITTADSSGNLSLLSGATTVVAVTPAGATVTGTLSTSGNTTLGDASTDTLNVASGTIVTDGLGKVGVGLTPASKLDVLNTFRVSYESGSVYYASITNISGGTVINANGDSAGMTFGTTAVGGTTPTTNMTLDNAGGLKLIKTIGVGNATPAASGSGITFPATQSGSSDANTLDDYEEGTWTPAQGSGITLVGTFSSSGKYTKIGNMVFLQGLVAGTTSVALANAGVIATGMPFTTTSTVVGLGGMTNAGGTISGTTHCGPNTTQFSGTPAITATGTIYFSMTYQTT